MLSDRMFTPKWQQIAGGGMRAGGVVVSADAALERLWMMLRVVACVAADDVHGEVAMVPADIEALCSTHHPAVADLRAIGEIIRQVLGLFFLLFLVLFFIFAF